MLQLAVGQLFTWCLLNFWGSNSRKLFFSLNKKIIFMENGTKNSIESVYTVVYQTFAMFC